MEHLLVTRLHVLVLLVREDVVRGQVSLRVAVLARLGERNVRDLARVTLDDDEVVLLQVARRAGRAVRGTGIRGRKVTLAVTHFLGGCKWFKEGATGRGVQFIPRPNPETQQGRVYRGPARDLRSPTRGASTNPGMSVREFFSVRELSGTPRIRRS